MGKIFSYAELKGKVKVGWVVKAVLGKPNPCAELSAVQNQKITDVDDGGFRINRCFHTYRENGYLEVVSGYEKTLDNLEHGDVLLDEDGDELTVIDVLPHLVFLSEPNRPEISNSYYTPQELRELSYTIKDQDSDLTELTLDEVAKLAKVPVKKLRIKD